LFGDPQANRLLTQQLHTGLRSLLAMVRVLQQHCELLDAGSQSGPDA
jgi:hypothetical protein